MVCSWPCLSQKSHLRVTFSKILPVISRKVCLSFYVPVHIIFPSITQFLVIRPVLLLEFLNYVRAGTITCVIFINIALKPTLAMCLLNEWWIEIDPIDCRGQLSHWTKHTVSNTEISSILALRDSHFSFTLIPGNIGVATVQTNNKPKLFCDLSITITYMALFEIIKNNHALSKFFLI